MEPGNPGSIWSGIKRSFRKGSSLTKFIYINIALFLLIKILVVFSVLFGIRALSEESLLNILSFPAYWENLSARPWTIFTYMFTHVGFMHLLFNMLWLYWFGSIFLNYFSGRELGGVYIMGGLFGALFYLLSYNLLPAFAEAKMNSAAIGASASIMAVVFAVCLYLPNHRIYVFLVGSVKLINLAAFTVILDIMRAIWSNNTGGHIAHLGGAFFGVLFVFGLRYRVNMTKAVLAVYDAFVVLFSGNKSVKAKAPADFSKMNDQEYNQYKKRMDDEENRILDKISRSGYDSLTRKEKEILFKSGKKGL
ncbi:rhomboid family intramembrane serine protease [Odoribacter sp. OttesenSCG-928-J03]|nr:rhomboid family intramembrane serine protease [Odoribacter sp. OttesenSCG-928-J03]